MTPLKEYMSEGTFPGSPSGTRGQGAHGPLGPALGRKDEQGRPVPYCWGSKKGHNAALLASPEMQGMCDYEGANNCQKHGPDLSLCGVACPNRC